MGVLDTIFGHLRTESEVMLKAPLAFGLLTVFGFAMGYVVATWYYSGRLSQQEGQISRYRIALGIDKASQGVLIELTNAELLAMSLTVAGKLRSFEVGLRNETENAVKGAKNDKDKAERSARIIKTKSDEFDRTLRSEAINIDTELRRRLGQEALASIVGLPPTFYAADNGAPLGGYSLMPSGMGMSALVAGVLADGIERMARVLPTETTTFPKLTTP